MNFGLRLVCFVRLVSCVICVFLCIGFVGGSLFLVLSLFIVWVCLNCLVKVNIKMVFRWLMFFWCDFSILVVCVIGLVILVFVCWGRIGIWFVMVLNV